MMRLLSIYRSHFTKFHLNQSKSILTPPFFFIKVTMLSRIMYLCVRCIDIAYFYDFSIGFWNLFAEN
jgi:hypothetical protein